MAFSEFPRMLLDPFEEDLDIPAALIQPRDRDRGKKKIVREKYKTLAADQVAISHTAERDGVIVLSCDAGWQDRLVRTETGVTRHGSRALPAQPCCPQRPRDEECARFVNSQQGAGNSDSHDPSHKRRPLRKFQNSRRNSRYPRSIP